MQQMPHMDYSKEVHQGWTDIDMPWIASLPPTELGGYMFVWDDDTKGIHLHSCPLWLLGTAPR